MFFSSFLLALERQQCLNNLTAIIATFPVYLNVLCVFLLLLERQLHFTLSQLIQELHCYCSLRALDIAEVSAGSFSFPERFCFNVAKTYWKLSLRKRESGKKDLRLKNTRSPSEVHQLGNCTVEQGDTYFGLGFFTLFKVSLLHKKSVQVLQVQLNLLWQYEKPEAFKCLSSLHVT